MPTPASVVFSDIRRRRALRQADLALKMGIGSSYLSQMETGARPISPAFIERMASILALSNGERTALAAAARTSVRQRTVPTTATAAEYELVDALWKVLGKLGSDQIQAMKYVILTNSFNASDDIVTS